MAKSFTNSMKRIIFLLSCWTTPLFATDPNLHWLTRPILDYTDAQLCQNRRVWLRQADRTWSLASDNGQIIKTGFEKVTDFDNAPQSRAVVKYGRVWHIIDKHGKSLKQFSFEGQKIQEVLGISDGLISFRVQGDKNPWRIADTTGKLIAGHEYEDIRLFSQNAGAVKKNGRWRLVDRQLRPYSRHRYDDVNICGEGWVAVTQGAKDGLWGYVDVLGNAQIGLQYLITNHFSQQRAVTAKWDGYHPQYGAIDKTGNWVIAPEYQRMKSFSEDLAAVQTWDGKWGFIDTVGQMVITPQFDSVTVFINNKAWVRTGGKWGILQHPLRGSPVQIRWTHFRNTVLNINETTFKLQVNLESKQPITRIEVYVDEQLYWNNVVRGGSARPRATGQLFEMDVLLNVGEHAIVVKAHNAAGESESEERRIVVQEHKGKRPQNKNYVLLIANQAYQTYGALNKPIEDADSLAHTLMSYYDFDYENIFRAYDATHSDIIQIFDSIQHILPTDSRLIVFYAGHGAYDSLTQLAYWIPIDGSLTDKNTWISAQQIDTFVTKLGKIRHFLLISDACHSGALVTRSGEQVLECQLLERMVSRKILTSAENVPVPDKSIFLETFLSVLRQQPYSCISTFELTNNIRKKVMNTGGMVPQYGTFSKSGDSGGDFIFKRREPFGYSSKFVEK
jgi:hypothetical protein